MQVYVKVAAVAETKVVQATWEDTKLNLKQSTQLSIDSQFPIQICLDQADKSFPTLFIQGQSTT